MDNYNLFKTQWDKWVDWFYLEDRNSILQQVNDIVYNQGVFNIINEARRLADKTKDGFPALSPMVHNLIDQSYFGITAIKICRILEENPENKKKEVYSLHRLIKEMRGKAWLLTREHIMAAKGGYEELKSIRESWGANCGRHGLAWRDSEKWQSCFDKLSGVSSSKRSLSDSIREYYLGNIIAKLELVVNRFKQYRNKFIAHCATRESRRIENADEISITYNEYCGLIQDIWKICKLLSTYMLKGEYFILPSPVFKFIEKPLVVKGNISILRDAWKRFEEQMDEDTQIILDELCIRVQ